MPSRDVGAKWYDLPILIVFILALAIAALWDDLTGKEERP